MKTAIIGSRSFTDYEHMKQCLAGAHITHIYSGGAKGADSLAERYAKEHSIPITIIKPDYQVNGKAATHIRNREIVDSSDSVCAFWNGKPGGTQSVIAYAEKTNKPVAVFYDPKLSYFSRKTLLGEAQSPERVKGMYSTLDASPTGGKALKVLKQQIITSNRPVMYRKYVEENFKADRFQCLEGKDNVYIAVPSTTGVNRFPRELCKKLQKTFGGVSYYSGHAAAVHEEQAKDLDGLQKVVNVRKYQILNESLQADLLKGKNIVLVDDVATTGASIDGMRQALYSRGIRVNNIVTLCQSELRLATERDFERIAEKAALAHPSTEISGKEKVEDIKVRLQQCFEGCLKHKLNYLERDITGNTPTRLMNKGALYGILNGEIERIKKEGRNILQILLQKRTEAKLDRGGVERVPDISDAEISRRGRDTRPGVGEYVPGTKSRITGGVEETRGGYANRTSETFSAGKIRRVKTLDELYVAVRENYSVTLPPSVLKVLEQGVTSGVLTIDKAEDIISTSINSSKNAGYTWTEKTPDPEIITAFRQQPGKDSIGDILIKQGVSPGKPFDAFILSDHGHKLLGNAQNIDKLKTYAEQYKICSHVRDSFNNHLGIEKYSNKETKIEKKQKERSFINLSM